MATETVTRRRWLSLLGAGAAASLLSGHSPYRQWDAYRKARLVLAVSATDDAAVQLGRALAALFAQHLPSSRATHARARDTNDLMRLLASRQLDVALLREADAHAALTGAPPFADNGGVALRTLGVLGTHLFVGLEQVPDASAYLLAETLSAHWREIDPSLVGQATGPRPPSPPSVPMHPGALQFYREHG